MESTDATVRASKRRRTGTYATRRTTLDSTLPSDPTYDQGESALSTVAVNGEGTYNVGKKVTEDNNGNGNSDRSHLSAEAPQVIAQGQEEKAPSLRADTRSRRGTTRKGDTQKASSDVDNGTSANSASHSRKRGSGTEWITGAAQDGVQVLNNDDNDENAEAGDRETPAKRATDDGSRPRSSGRARRPPQRFSSPQAAVSSEVASSQKPSTQNRRARSKPDTAAGVNGIVANLESPRPKGILTPSKHGRDRRAGPRKSVAFEQEQDERQIGEQLGFKDIDISATKPSKKGSTTPTRSPPVSKTLSLEELANDAHQIAASELSTEKGGLEENDAEDEEPLNTAPDISEVISLQPPPTVNLDIQTQISSDQEDNAYITSIKSQVLSRITNTHNYKQTPSPISSHLQSQYTALHSLLTATVAAGESNSLLLLGSRGSGKSLLISHALADLARSHGDDFHVVRLNGFFQTDDKLALREIWRQLGREMAVSEDETGEVSSYADTMASLLSLLSHPEELADPDSMILDNDENNPDHQLNRAAKSVIFVMDEFDLFTTHPRQTLLYNLFDIAQAKKAPIAVIGCSCRMDVVDCLEKRVKSRFSHRWLHLPAAKSLTSFEDSIASVLCLPTEGKEAQSLDREQLDWRSRWNQAIKTRLLPAPPTQALLKKSFYSTKSVPDVLAALYIPIAMLNVPSSETLQANDRQDQTVPLAGISSALSSSSPSLLTLLPHLPTLHLTLLICAARIEAIHDLTALNFALVYAHYTELLTRSRMQRSVLSSLTRGGAVTGAAHRSWSKDTARSAWEELVQWELLVPVSGQSGGIAGGKLGDEGLGGDGVATRMFRVDVTLDEVAWAVKEKLGNVGTGEVLEKWCKET